MSKVNVKLTDGSLTTPGVSINSSEDMHEYDSWNDIMIVKLGSYILEYDHSTKELTITGGQLMTLDAIDDHIDLRQIQFCRTLVLRPDGE